MSHKRQGYDLPSFLLKAPGANIRLLVYCESARQGFLRLDGFSIIRILSYIGEEHVAIGR